jgi:hypothetical protein
MDLAAQYQLIGVQQLLHIRVRAYSDIISISYVTGATTD